MKFKRARASSVPPKKETPELEIVPRSDNGTAKTDIPLLMTLTPSSPCDPSGGPLLQFPPAEEPFHSSQLHPYAIPSSVSGTSYTSSSLPIAHSSHSAHSTHSTRTSIEMASKGFSTINTALPSSTTIEMDRIMKQDEAAVNDFIPPRQAMNSDESDFDWDGDINIDNHGQIHKKKKERARSHWRKLSPCLRMVILMVIFAPIIALPAILTEIYLVVPPEVVPPAQDTPQDIQKRTRKDIVVLVFTWLSFMWCIVCITNWGVDIIPVVIVRLTSIFTSSKLETTKTRLLIFVATKKFIKWLLAACWATGSFAFLTNFVRPIVREQLWSSVVLRILGAIIAGCALVFVEKVLLQIISKNFHQIAYADRIKENKYALQVLDRLGHSKKNVKKQRPTHSRNNTAENTDYMNPFPAGFRPQSRSPSSDNSDTIHMNEQGSPGYTPLVTPVTTPTEHPGTRSSTGLAPSVRRMQRDSRGKPNDILKGINKTLQGIAMADSAPTKDINSTSNAKRLAKTLFYNLQGNGDDLVVEDFYPYFDAEEDAKEAFAIFDKDGNGDISKREMKEKIFYIYKERKDLHTALRDLSQAVGKLDVIFLTIVTVVWLLIILSIFGTSVVQNMLSIGSFLVALSFVFGNSLKTLFENIVFLFITHPYDSGDLCNIDGTDMYVREVGLNSTMFVTWDGKRMYYPNNILSQKPIHNVRRSPNMSEKIVLNVDCYTPQVKILELRARMRDFLSKESKEFLPDMEIQIQEMDVKLKISMVIEHKGNWQDSGRRWARRTKFNFALKEAVEDLGIKYFALPQRLEVVGRSAFEQETERQSNDQDKKNRDQEPSTPVGRTSSQHLYRRKTIARPQGE